MIIFSALSLGQILVMQMATFCIWFKFSQVSDQGPSWPSCFQSVGALDLQDGDVLRYTKIISKFPTVVQAGHSAYPGLKHQTLLPEPNRVSALVGQTLE